MDNLAFAKLGIGDETPTASTSIVRTRLSKGEKREQKRALAAAARARIPQFPDEILGAIFDHFIHPLPKPSYKSQLHSGAILGNPRRLRTLRSLCLVSKRFDSLARPRLYRHVGIPNDSFHDTSEAHEQRPGLVSTLDLLMRSLNSSPSLARMVRTLHLWVDDSNIAIVSFLLTLCKDLHMVSLIFRNLVPAEPLCQEGATYELCNRLEQLKSLEILSWEASLYGHHQELHLVSLFNIKLPNLASLRIMSISADESPTEHLLGHYDRATLPRLQYLELFFSRYRHSESMEAANFKTRGEAVRYMQGMLSGLLDQSPDIISLNITTNLLRDQLCHAIPPILAQKLEYLELKELDGSIGRGGAVLDVHPLQRMSKLSSLLSENPIQEAGWYSLPSSLSTLELSFTSTDELARFSKVLCHASNLPILQKLHVYVHLPWREDQPDPEPDPADIQELDNHWEKIVDITRKRGIRATLESAVHNRA